LSPNRVLMLFAKLQNNTAIQSTGDETLPALSAQKYRLLFDFMSDFDRYTMKSNCN
jgi:hypothetical protein